MLANSKGTLFGELILLDENVRELVEIFSHELHQSHRGTHVRDIEHD